jgi:hypothetical protein
VTAFLIVCFIATAVFVAAMVLWPQRIPRDRSVDGIRERVEAEAEGDNRGC